jgi:hypothetical protein
LICIEFAAGDKFDHDITNSIVNVIWAHGQIVQHYMPTIPPPAANSNIQFTPDFYRMRELKYHGLIGRGSTRLNFMNPPPRDGSQCNYTVPNVYSARWGPSATDASKIMFELKVEGGYNTTWVGIGFSNNRLMPESDIITTKFDNAPFKVEDRWASVKARPSVDDDQSQIEVLAVRNVNGKLWVTFTRTVVTADSRDLSLDEPRYFLFGWGQIEKGAIQYHGSNRYISNDKILPTQCSRLISQQGQHNEPGGDIRGDQGSSGGLEDDEKWGIAVACVVVVLAIGLGLAYVIYR